MTEQLMWVCSCNAESDAHEDWCAYVLGSRLEAAEAENARLARHYEELRQSTDGSSESMTHADACHVVEALEQQLAEVNAESARLRDRVQHFEEQEKYGGESL